MLTKLRIKNFKAWRDTGDVRLAPLTILFGANSSGKSSLGHLLLALKQTAASADRRRALHTGDEASLIDLGTFIDCLHGHDRKAQLEFTLDWSTPNSIEVRNPLDQSQIYDGRSLRLTSTLAANAQEQPVVRHLRYELLHEDGQTILSATRRDTTPLVGWAGWDDLRVKAWKPEPDASRPGSHRRGRVRRTPWRRERGQHRAIRGACSPAVGRRRAAGRRTRRGGAGSGGARRRAGSCSRRAGRRGRGARRTGRARS